MERVTFCKDRPDAAMRSWRRSQSHGRKIVMSPSLRPSHAFACCLLWLCATAPAAAQAPLYQYQHSETRWASPENPEAKKGAAARANRGAKGRAYVALPAGETLVLAEVDGPGVIDRFWLTINDRTPEMLRGLRLEATWDGAETPAVSVPLGDLFAAGAGALLPIETALVASPEGRSFVATIPMPFREHARLALVNESGRDLGNVFYDVDLRRLPAPPDMLYFHAWWSRERATTLGRDFEVLPRVHGRGRFLGMLVTTLTDPRYGRTWFGEGEVKLYLDGDRDLPTAAGTGTEDYIGTAWGQGAFVHRYQGAPVADVDHGRWTFYRFHIPDPVFFARDLRVTLQQIGGAPRPEVQAMLARGVPLRPVTVDAGADRFARLLESDPPRSLDDTTLPDGWTNFYRSDDVSAVALFYLDSPENGLPAVAPAAERQAALRPPEEKAKD